MRRGLILSCLMIVASILPLAAQAPAAAATLPELFGKAKEQVKLGSYEAALTTLQEIDTLSQQPGLEKDREALRPSLTFYRGVCHAALGKDEEARGEFRAFLEASPNTKLDPAMYPKKVITAFEEAQKGMAPLPDGSKGTGIAAAYATFKTPDVPTRGSVGEDWADGPARFLLTSSEAAEFRHLPDSIARSEFVTKFWKAHDSKPETPENEFREELEKRVAFADQYFVQGEKRGSLTDRGTVFVLLGPPSRSSQRPIKTGEDTGDSPTLYAHSAGNDPAAGLGQSSPGRAMQADGRSGPGTTLIEPSENWREVWRYLRKILPGGLPYEWVDFDFITKKGYGEAVLQRDQAALDALDRAKARLAKP
jgi:GWxTD domain-containing protein